MPGPDIPGWRSLLYVPAHQERMVARAHTRGADAVILDLEDAVPEAAKEAARSGLGHAVGRARAGGGALVRINGPWRHAWRDLEAAVDAGADAVVLPKVRSAEHVRMFADYLDELEAGPGARHTLLLAIIESAEGMENAPEIARASPRLRAVIPGNEDLALELGIEPDPERMLPVVLPLLLAAAAAGIRVIGTIGGGADYRNLDEYRRRLDLSRGWGLRGATCIHPDQIAVIHDACRPSPAQIDEARAIVTAFEAADGGSISVAGRMIDRPVYLRALRLLELAGARP